MTDINRNRSEDELSSPRISLRPSLARSPKRVQFPTLRDIDKHIAAPGLTPVTSESNFRNGNSPRRKHHFGKLINSSTSLEVEVDQEDELPSIAASTCTIATTNTEITHSPCATTATSASTSYRISTPSDDVDSLTHRRRPEQQVYFQEPQYRSPIPFTPKKRGSSMPARKSTSTEPDYELLGSPNPNKSNPTGILPNKSILRKTPLQVKDTNSNLVPGVTSSVTLSSSAPPSSTTRSIQEEENVGNFCKIKKQEMEENAGEPSVHPEAKSVSPASASQLSRNTSKRMQRTRSTLSSGSFATFYSEVNSTVSTGTGKRSLSQSEVSEVLPPMMTQSRGGRSVQKQLPNLTSVLAELRQKEVVFDRTTAIQALKARILRGERVTHEEIKAIRNMTLPPHQRHLGYRLPWSKDLYCEKGLVHIPTPNKPSPQRNTFGTMDDLRIPYGEDQMTMEHYGRRQYVVNLAGFEDDHISLYLEGKNRLVLRAERNDGLEGEDIPMTVTETILLPPDLPADNLRIVRKASGTTIIEESWRF